MPTSTVFLYLLILPPGAPLSAFPALKPESLKAAGLPADGASLLVYLRQRILAEGDTEKLAALVKQLGDRSFAVRQKATSALIAAGPKAFPFLRQAANDGDAEVRSRANSCLQSLDRQIAVLPLAVQRLVHERPTNEIPTLLGLVSIADGPLAETVLSALAILSMQHGADAALIDALKSAEPVQRVAAVWTLGRCGSRFRAQLLPMQKDADARVRMAAAVTSIAAGGTASVSALASLLDEKDESAARSVEAILTALARDGGPPLSPKSTAAAKRAAWEGWSRLQRDNLELSALDDWLPAVTMPQRLRALARNTVLAMRLADFATLRSMMGPTFMFGINVYNSQQWFESRNWTANPALIYFRGLKVAPATRYLPWARSPREVEFLDRMKHAETWTVFFAADQESWGVVFIQRQDHQLRLAGISTDRAGAPE